MDAKQRAYPGRRGFTLVELLTVIVIIGILAALISAAVVAAIGSARNARVTLEIRTMDQQLNLFKNTYGDYPPSNLSDSAAVTAFLRRAFPRYEKGTYASVYARFSAELSACGVPVSNDPAVALVFWLGGVPSGGKLTGFSKDVENPFAAPISGVPRTDPLFEFDRDRLNVATMRYYPNLSGAIEADAPYVYFRATEYAAAVFTHNAGGENVTLRPYVNNRSGTPEYANPKTFQIISAGRDNWYGGSGSASPTFPTTNFTSAGHHDNLTNFTDGKLEDAMQ